MALRLGVSRRTLVAWEKGEQFPNALVLSQAAEMGVDVLFVLTDQRTPQSAQALSQEDSAVLASYRAASEPSRAHVRWLLDLVSKHDPAR